MGDDLNPCTSLLKNCVSRGKEVEEENQEKGSDSIAYSVLTSVLCACVYIYMCAHKTNIPCLSVFCPLSQFTRVSRDQCHVLEPEEESSSVTDRESRVQQEHKTVKAMFHQGPAIFSTLTSKTALKMYGFYSSFQASLLT